ncbi:QueT transporter family protein [Haloferax sp. YSSS75]|uniref:QueT transporter family protein n=1 Tax=Haloferax sp. YSSS75 TaxID=3388564 RepID=UPI00398D1312
MREVFTMWRDGRMVALTAVITAVYMTGLIPFKGFAIVPGFTEIRPANVLPVVLGLLFGPAAAWGAGFGNLFSDAFGGTLTAGSTFGFVGNFFSAFVAYKLWGNLGRLSSGEKPKMRSVSQLVEYGVISFVAAATTATIISWGVDLLGLFPFSVFAIIITLNNFLAAAILGPILLYVLYPRFEAAELLYTDILAQRDDFETPARQRQIPAIGIAVVSVSWLVVGILVGVVVEGVPFGVPASGIVLGTGGSMVQTAIGAVAFALILGFSAMTGSKATLGLPGSRGAKRAERRG